MKGCINTQGYVIYSLVNRSEFAHRLVGIYFIPNPKNLPFINHKDGNKINNDIINLEWCTPKENIIHAATNGLMRWRRGEDALKSKLNNIQVLEIYNSPEKTTFLSKKYSIDQSVIFDIKSGNSWKHLTGGVNVMKPRKYLSKDVILSIYNEKIPLKLSKLIISIEFDKFKFFIHEFGKKTGVDIVNIVGRGTGSEHHGGLGIDA